MKKVMLGTLIHTSKEYCLHSWFERLYDLRNQFSKILVVDTSEEIDLIKYKTSNYHFERVGDSNLFRRLSKGRILIFKEFLKSSCDYLFILECDLFITDKVLPTLLRRDKGVIGVPYIMGYLRDPETHLKKDYLVSVLSFNRRITMTYEGLKLSGKGHLRNVNEAGMGCLLIRRDVIEKIVGEFKVSSTHCDDKAFYQLLREHGVDRYVDISLFDEIKHYPNFHMEYCTYDRFKSGK
jgi:hypothetical protein